MKLMAILKEVVDEKVVVKKPQNYLKAVADAYEQAPKYDSSSVKHWAALNKSNYEWFGKISSEVELIFYSENEPPKNTISIGSKTFKLMKVNPDPYSSQSQMKKDYTDNKRLYISIDYSDHPYFSVEDNIVFRFVHDYLIHIKGGYSFGKGELNAYNLHAKLVPKDAIPAIFTEVVGQAAVFMTYGTFPEQKVAVLDGFDYEKIGYYNGELIDGGDDMRIEK